LPAPVTVFGFLLATLYGASSHFLFGGDARRLALFLLAGWLGFAGGQILGDFLSITFADIGMLNFCPATGGAYFLLLLAFIVTRRPPT
jgi:hypothetical protein